MANFIANVKAVLDDSELVRLDNLCNKQREAKVKITLSGDVNQLNNVNQNIDSIRNNARNPITLTMNAGQVVTQLNAIEAQLLRIQAIHLNLGGDGRTRNANREITRQYNLASKYQKRMAKQLSSFELLDTDRDLSSVNTILNQYQNTQREYSRILEQYGNGFTNAQHDQLREFEIDTEQALERMRSKFQDTISKNLDNGKYDGLLGSLIEKFNQIENPANNLRLSIDNISNSIIGMRDAINSGDFNQLMTHFNNFNHELNITKNNINSVLNREKVLKEQQKEQDKLQKESDKQRKIEVNSQYDSAIKQQKKIAKLLKDFEKLDTERNVAERDEILAQYAIAQKEYSNILNQYGNEFSKKQRKLLNDTENDTEDSINRIRSQLQDSIIKGLNDGNYDSKNLALGHAFKELGDDSTVLRGQIDAVTDALNEMRLAAISGDFDALFTANNNFQHAYTTADNAIKALKIQKKEQEKVFKEQQKAKKLDADKGLLISDIDLWSKNNFEAATKLKTEIDNIRTSIENCNDEADFSNLKQQFEQIQKNVKNQNIVDSITKAGKFGEFELDFKDLKNSLNQIREVNSELEKATSNLESTKNALDTALGNPNDVEGILNAYNNYLKATEEFNAEYNKVKHKQDEDDAEKNLERRKEKLDYEAKTWLKEHSAATQKYGQRIEDLRAKIASCNDIQLNDLEGELQDIQFAAERAGVATKSIGDKLKDEIKGEFTQLFSISRLFDYGVDAIRDMYQQVVSVDSAMVNLKKVTDETDATYNKFLDSAADNAIALGRSMSSYIEQTADWTKLGYTLKEAQELSKLSSVYANVAEIDDATAVSDMVTAMKAFNIETANAVQITDALNELGNRFATDAGSLGSGLTKAAASMSNAGVDLNQTLAMLTGGTEITQNATEFGNFLKTASMRIRGMKGELEELGEEVDPTVDSISKVQTQILNITKNTSKPINIFDDSGNFRNYYTIMEEIASIYDELTSTDQAKLDEILFGKVRANQGAALIKAFQSGQIQKAYATAVGSEGSAMAEQEKWMESLQAKMASFEAAWQHLSTSVMQSDFLGGFINFGTNAVEFFADLVDSVGALNTALLGAGITSFFWNLD